MWLLQSTSSTIALMNDAARSKRDAGTTAGWGSDVIADLLRVRGRMADGDAHTCGDKVFDEWHRARDFGRARGATLASCS